MFFRNPSYYHLIIWILLLFVQEIISAQEVRKEKRSNYLCYLFLVWNKMPCVSVSNFTRVLPSTFSPLRLAMGSNKKMGKCKCNFVIFVHDGWGKICLQLTAVGVTFESRHSTWFDCCPAVCRTIGWPLFPEPNCMRTICSCCADNCNWRERSKSNQSSSFDEDFVKVWSTWKKCSYVAKSNPVISSQQKETFLNNFKQRNIENINFV